MAISLVKGRKTIGSIGELILDARISEDHQRSNDVTQYPVEFGSPVTDHVRNRPLVLTMTGMVSDAPIEYLEFSEDLNREESGETRSRGAYDQLISIYESKDVVDVQTTLDLYTNMVIQDLTIPRNSGVGAELRFTATLIQISKARTEFAEINIENVTDINSSAPEIDKRAAAEADKGKKEGSAPSESFILQLLNWIRNR